MKGDNQMAYIKLTIAETGRGNLKEKPQTFNEIIETFLTMGDTEDYLVERYGKLPKGRNKIYMDTSKGPQVIGFLHSFWNKDWSHNSKSWYQTDWITLTEVTEVPVLIHNNGGNER